MKTKISKHLYSVKFLALALALTACMTLLGGCSKSSRLPDAFDEETLKEQAVKDIEAAASNDYEAWVARFQPDLQASLTEATYNTYLTALAEAGPLKEYGKCAFVGQEQDGAQYAACIINVEYEEKTIQYSLGYNSDMELIQFFIK